MKDYFLLLCLLLIPMISFAQEHQHDNGHDEHQHNSTSTTTPSEQPHTQEENKEPQVTGGYSEAAPFSAFPNLHPLVVHFPIVFLIAAVMAQLASFFIFKKPLAWVVLSLLILAAIGGVLAAFFTHPHLSPQVPEHIRKLYETHEFHAYLSLGLAGAALLVKIISLNSQLRKWAEITTTLILLASVYTISVTGHLGNQMVFLEGVGVKGQHLELHEHDDHRH